MEKTCSVHPCRQRSAFVCKCRSPPVYICESHFSAHIKQKGFTHRYEFISVQISQSQSPIPLRSSSVKQEEIKKVTNKFSSTTRKIILTQRSSPKPLALTSTTPKIYAKPEVKDRISYSSEEFYEGSLLNGREHGNGSFVGVWESPKCSRQSFVYSGEWRNGAPHGKGELVFGECELEGTWFQGNLTGDGTLKLTNGDEYTGEFFECKFHGNGRYRFKDVEIVGHFTDHLLTGPEFYSLVDFEFLDKIQRLKDKDLKAPDRFKIICEIFLAPLTKYKDPVTSIKSCFFFKGNSFQALSVHTENLEKIDHSLKSSQRFPSLGGLCEINNCLFNAGGLIGEKTTGLAFTLNPETWELHWLEPCTKRSTPCALPLNNKVYLFGGSDLFLNFMKANQVFDFATQKWSALSDLPVSSDGMAGCVIGKFFVVSGYMHTKVYVFDSSSQKFSDVFELNDFKEKVFCSGNGSGFLMCDKKLYEAKVGNPFEWRLVRDVGFRSGWPVGVPVRRGECFYWYTSDKELWKFDKESKGVFLLKTFK